MSNLVFAGLRACTGSIGKTSPFIPGIGILKFKILDIFKVFVFVVLLDSTIINIRRGGVK